MKVLGVLLTTAALAAAGLKPAPVAKGENAAVAMEATLHLGRDAVKQLLGSDLGGFYVVLDVKVTPKQKLSIYRDDFLLRTDRDGERSKPFSPTQIAGRGVLVVSTTGGAAIMGQEDGPIWGGIGGRPRRMGGEGGSVGNAGTTVTNQTTVDRKKEEDPLLGVLSRKVLPEKECAEPVSGLLYFPMEIKQKVKDLELIYSTPAGKLSLRFH